MTLGILAPRAEDAEVLVRGLASWGEVRRVEWAKTGESIFSGLDRGMDLVFVHDAEGRGKAEGCLDFLHQAHGGSSLALWALCSRESDYWKGFISGVMEDTCTLPPGEWFLAFVCGRRCRLGIPLSPGGLPLEDFPQAEISGRLGILLEEMGLPGCWGLLRLGVEASGRISLVSLDPAPGLEEGGLFRRSLRAGEIEIPEALEDLLQEALDRRDRQASLRTSYKDGV